VFFGAGIVVELVFSNTSKICLCIRLSVLVDPGFYILIEAAYLTGVSPVSIDFVSIFFCIRYVLVIFSSTWYNWLSILFERWLIQTLISSIGHNRLSVLLERFLIESLVVHVTWVRSDRLTEALQIVHVIWLKRLLSRNVIVVTVWSHRASVVLKAFTQVSRKTTLSL
jgi:hypothetical protein